jgi:Domain of unknown function (DUF4349)
MRLFFLAAVILTGCTPARREASSAERQERAPAAAPAALMAQADRPVAGRVRRGTGGTEDVLTIQPAAETPNMVIRTGVASVEVDSLEPAVALVRSLASRLGGYVANTTMQTGRGELRSASLEVKMPAARFDEALSALMPIGKLESVNVNAEDVGEEFTDVTARMENARRLESRLIDLLAARTGKLKDVLEVEQALARVREEIERYEGRLRYLRAHADMSTLTINVHEPVPVVGHAGSSVLGEAFKQAWRNFVDLVALCIRSLGVVLPVGLVAAAAWLAYERRRRARATA